MFWAVAAVMCIVVAIAFVVVIMRTRAAAAPSAAYDLQVYRDQLKDVDRDVARGTVSADEAERIRLEISRRILDADKTAQRGTDTTPTAPPHASALAIGLAALAITGSFGAYFWLGAPGYPDLPLAERIEMAEQTHADRPSQAFAEADTLERNPPPSINELDPAYVELVEQLRTVVAERPNDLQGHRLLARQEGGLGNYSAAWQAQARVVQLQGEAVRARDYTDLADMMVLAAGGYVSPEAEAVISRALDLDPLNGVARYYSGLMFAQTGRPDLAFRIWAQLLAESPADAPWQDPIRGQIEFAAIRAGVDYVPPERDAAPVRGPSTEDIEAAQDMTAADRLQMIEGMVSGLAQRLGTEGGPPEEWARLIRAYGVLGRIQEAEAIWREAKKVFPDDINRVVILEAARDAGVEQ